MCDQASGPTRDQQLAAALDTIEYLSQRLARVPPPRPMPLDVPAPIDASQAFLSGQWKRRPGNIIPAPSAAQLHTSSPPIGTQLDPWVRRDVPALDEDPADAATRAIYS